MELNKGNSIFKQELKSKTVDKSQKQWINKVHKSLEENSKKNQETERQRSAQTMELCRDLMVG